MKFDYSPLGYCVGVEDGLDGFAIHTLTCPRWPNSSVGPDFGPRALCPQAPEGAKRNFYSMREFVTYCE